MNIKVKNNLIEIDFKDASKANVIFRAFEGKEQCFYASTRTKTIAATADKFRIPVNKEFKKNKFTLVEVKNPKSLIEGTLTTIKPTPKETETNESRN